MKKQYYLILLAFSVIFLAGCGAYKELEPDPEINFREGQLIKLDDDGDPFELSKGKKYFIKFPRPQFNDFFIVLTTPQSAAFSGTMVTNFNDGDGPFKPITPDADKKDTLSAFPVDTLSQNYYYIFDNIPNEFNLEMRYRYVPVWRFQFENKYQSYYNTLQSNRVARSIYDAVDQNYSLNKIDFSQENTSLRKKNAELKSLLDKLNTLKALIPPALMSSNDPAVANYKIITGNLAEELDFQDKYGILLDVLGILHKNKDNTGEVLDNTETFLEFFDMKARFTKGQTDKVKLELSGVLSNAVVYYNGLISSKNDYNPIKLGHNVLKVQALAKEVSGSVAADLKLVTDFIAEYNSAAEMAVSVRLDLDDIYNKIKAAAPWPADDYYDNIINQFSRAGKNIPSDKLSMYKPYNTYKCSQLLSALIKQLNTEFGGNTKAYETASSLVKRINKLKIQDDYKSIISLLIQNRNLDFLLKQYPDVDNLYVTAEGKAVTGLIAGRRFPEAETRTQKLFTETDFVNSSKISEAKNKQVLTLENALFESVLNLSKMSVDSFTVRNLLTIDNVEGIYKDSSFVPLYDIKFASGGAGVVASRKKQIEDYLTNMKHISFPEKAITAIYQDFLKNINNRGVEKLRAIAVHGKYYKGTNNTVKNTYFESDVYIAKWIVQPKTYRRVFALPTTTNRTGNNTYMLRLILRIPTDATFPTFDINIKLPEEVGKNAGSKQWYDKITLNGKVVKNEGRVKITSPTSANGYECQVGPVTMDKDGNNVLEITFSYPAFKVFEVSVMAQEPIIKKN
ncbi:MAG: hypothetical protein HUU43_05625 [Ignavibacteriaceae bacterium]|nr:hypothetical protein [Ignavibacteriaceae bacterium]